MVNKSNKYWQSTLETYDLNADKYHDALTHEIRRLVLQYLTKTDGPATIGELAEHVAANTDRRAEKVKISLHHAHLPKLDGAGLIEHDQELDTAQLTVTEEAVKPYRL